jgi:radical SAM protein with 4Fe4S-binding SPASM domain
VTGKRQVRLQPGTLRPRGHPRGIRAGELRHERVCSLQYTFEADGAFYPCDFYMFDEYALATSTRIRMDALDERRREIRFIERSQSCPTVPESAGGSSRAAADVTATDTGGYACTTTARR